MTQMPGWGAFISLCLIALVLPAAAETRVGASNQPWISDSQLRVLDGRASEQYRNAARALPDHRTETVRIPRFTGSQKSRFIAPARSIARRYGIPEDLFLRLIQQESAWNPGAISVKGAIGLAQLLPGTARALGVNPRDPLENLEGGAKFLAKQYRTFGSWPLALAAYNAGPGAVQKYDGIPPFKETRTYVARIWGQTD